MSPASSSISNSEGLSPQLQCFATIGWRLVVLALIIGTALYFVVFAMIVSKPLTNIDGEYLELKTKHLLATAGQPRIVILAGSNGAYSHRCETIEQAYKVPCTNMSMYVLLSFRWQLARLQPLLAAGDVLYMPLEYRGTDYEPDRVGVEASYVVRFARSELQYYSPRQRLAALFYFDLRYLLSALSEMALRWIGFPPRYSIARLTPQGDESGHTALKGEAYKPNLEAWRLSIQAAQNDRYWIDVLDILNWAVDHGVRVVGGLPTVFQGVEISQELIDALAKRFRAAGGCFVVLDNKSRYSRASFYDTGYHLNEETQILHTRAVGRILVNILQRQDC
jgi:hypothetical protein